MSLVRTLSAAMIAALWTTTLGVMVSASSCRED
jgi:hypothetical protein